jgi:hypothetical protein
VDFIGDHVKTGIESLRSTRKEVKAFVKYIEQLGLANSTRQPYCTRVLPTPAECGTIFLPTSLVSRRQTSGLRDSTGGFKLSMPANASVKAIIDRFRTEETMVKLSFYQAAHRNLGSDVNKSRKLNMKDRDEAAGDQLPQHAYIEALIDLF